MQKILDDIQKKTIHMNRQEKLGYLWTYYKYWAIIPVFIIVFLSLLLSAWLGKNNSALHVLISDTHSYSVEKGNNLISSYSDFLGVKDQKKDPIVFDDSLFFTTSHDNYEDLLMDQKFSALVMSDCADIMIARNDTLSHYALERGCYNLQELLSPELFAKLDNKGLILRKEVPESSDLSSTKLIAYSIDLSTNKQIKKMNLDLNTISLSVLKTTKKATQAQNFITFLFQDL